MYKKVPRHTCFLLAFSMKAAKEKKGFYHHQGKQWGWQQDDDCHLARGSLQPRKTFCLASPGKEPRALAQALLGSTGVTED